MIVFRFTLKWRECRLQMQYKEPPPPAPLIHVFTPFLAEFTWSRLLRSPCQVHALPAVLCWTLSCLYAMTASHFLMQLGGWGCCKPPSRSRAELWWVFRGKSSLELQKSGIFRYKIQPKNSTSWFSFFLQNEFKGKDHPSDVPNRANDTFAQI